MEFSINKNIFIEFLILKFLKTARLVKQMLFCVHGYVAHVHCSNEFIFLFSVIFLVRKPRSGCTKKV